MLMNAKAQYPKMSILQVILYIQCALSQSSLVFLMELEELSLKIHTEEKRAKNKQ